MYTASLDGTIKLWDYAEAAVQQTWNVGEEIEDMVLPNRQLAVLSCRRRAGVAGRLMIYSFTQKKLLDRTVKLSVPGRLVCSPDGAHIVTLDKNSVVVLSLAHPNVKPMTMHHTKALTVRLLLRTIPRTIPKAITGTIPSPRARCPLL